MKVLDLGLDPTLIEPHSVAATRNRMYGEIVDEFTIVIHGNEDDDVSLAENVHVYAVGGASKLVRFFRVYKKASELIRKNSYDVIATQDPYFFGLIAYVLAKKHHLGFELHILGFEKLSGFRKLLAKFLLPHASSVRANSERLRKSLTGEFGVAKERLHLVPVYLQVRDMGLDGNLKKEDAERQARLRKEFSGHYGTHFNFVTISRLVPIKNIPMQIDAVQKLKEKHPEVMLHIVGSGPEEAVLRKRISERGLSGNVVLHGHKAGLDLGIFYTECDAFMLTSFAEGWPAVVFEAASAKLPVIMTDVGCAGEFIVDGESGLVVPVDDRKALATAMKRYVTDASLRGRCAAAVYEALSARPNRDEILAGYKRSWEYAAAHPL